MAVNSAFYLFPLRNGKYKLGYGTSPDEALKILGYRLTEEELAEILPGTPKRIRQQELQDYIEMLG